MVFAPSSVHREQYGSFWSPEGFAGAPLVLALPENRHESNVCGRIRYRMCTFSVLYQRKLALIGPIWNPLLARQPCALRAVGWGNMATSPQERRLRALSAPRNRFLANLASQTFLLGMV